MAQMIEGGTRWLLASAFGSAIGLVVWGACNSPLTVGPQIGRYAIVSVSGQVHRLDTATGEIRAFVLGPEDETRSTVEASGGPFKFVEIGTLRPDGQE